MLIPLKNGVIVYSCEYGCYWKADCYILKGYGWLFRINNSPMFDREDEDFKVQVIDMRIDEHFQHGTILAREECVLISDEFGREYLSGKEADYG